MRWSHVHWRLLRCSINSPLPPPPCSHPPPLTSTHQPFFFSCSWRFYSYSGAFERTRDRNLWHCRMWVIAQSRRQRGQRCVAALPLSCRTLLCSKISVPHWTLCHAWRNPQRKSLCSHAMSCLMDANEEKSQQRQKEACCKLAAFLCVARWKKLEFSNQNSRFK